MNNDYMYTIKDVKDTADVVKTTVVNPLSSYEFADVDDICSNVIECIFDTIPNVQDTSIEFAARVAMDAIESVCAFVRASNGGNSKWNTPKECRCRYYLQHPLHHLNITSYHHPVNASVPSYYSSPSLPSFNDSLYASNCFLSSSIVVCVTLYTPRIRALRSLPIYLLCACFSLYAKLMYLSNIL